MQRSQAIGYNTRTMQLRTPQAESLILFTDYLESDTGRVLLGNMRKSERKSIPEIESLTRSHFQSTALSGGFQSFDGRAFPAFTFALAT